MEAKKKNQAKAVELPVIFARIVKKEFDVNFCSAGVIPTEEPYHTWPQDEGERV